MEEQHKRREVVGVMVLEGWSVGPVCLEKNIIVAGMCEGRLFFTPGTQKAGSKKYKKTMAGDNLEGYVLSNLLPPTRLRLLPFHHLPIILS